MSRFASKTKKTNPPLPDLLPVHLSPPPTAPKDPPLATSQPSGRNTQREWEDAVEEEEEEEAEEAEEEEEVVVEEEAGRG
jgi:hypothetical protein